jgi:soluble lytic murein transglycosylase
LTDESECGTSLGGFGAESLAAGGRFWHAARAVRPPAGTRPLPAESVLLHAVIAEGLGRYARVDELLRRARGGDSLPSFLVLAARADERAERWRAAEQRYRRLLALAGTPPEDRDRAAVRLALVLQRTGRRDSASVAWRRAAQAVSELADWFAIRRAVLEPDTAPAFAAVAGARTPGAVQRAELFMAARRAAAGNLVGALETYRRYGGPLDLARVEYQLGRRRSARLRADSVLAADPTRPAALLAATFLTARFDTLSLAEYLAVSRAYRARDDLVTAERFARRAVQRSDTSVQAWLEVARVAAAQRDIPAALRAVDSAGARARRRRATLIAAARIEVLLAAEEWNEADSLLVRLARAYRNDSLIAGAALRLADRYRARGRAADELRWYGILVRRFPLAAAGTVARFRLGLLRYAAGDRDSATALLEDVVRRDSAARLGIAPRYWSARIRLEGGDTTAAAELRRLAAAFPLRFYGVRARQLLGDTAFLVDTPLALPRPGSFPPARARQRIRLLAELGFAAEARAEAAGWIADTTASVQLLLAAAQAAGDAHYARESIALGEAARARAGMTAGVARALFPYPYRGLIEAEADENCVDPLLLAAVIRQESRFEPRAVSHAGARGIAQVLPLTAQRMAARLGLGPWEADLLFVPDFNLHLGARYLFERQTRDSFPALPLLASYNAGATRVTRWRRWPEFADPDLFAERVSIAETRDYVHTVYASYEWYRQAYPPSGGTGPLSSPP